MPSKVVSRLMWKSGGGVFRSTDNGDSWTQVNNGLACGNIRSLAINPGGDIFAGTTGCGDGLYRSTDNGDSWTLTNTGLTSTDFVALAINSTDARVFAGTYSQMGDGEGMFRPTDDGDNLDGTKWRLYSIQCERRSNQLCLLHLCGCGWWCFSINQRRRQLNRQ